MSSKKSQQPLILPHQTETIEIHEFDQSNKLIATYLKTSELEPKEGYRRPSDIFKSLVSGEKSERIDIQACISL